MYSWCRQCHLSKDHSSSSNFFIWQTWNFSIQNCMTLRECLSPKRILRTGGFCLIYNKTYLTLFRLWSIFNWPLPLIRGQLSTVSPLYFVNDDCSPSIPPGNHVTLWKTSDHPQRWIMRLFVTKWTWGIGRFCWFYNKLSSFPSKALGIFMILPLFAVNFLQSPPYTLLGTTEPPSIPPQNHVTRPSPPTPPLRDESWLSPNVKYCSLHLIIRQASPIVKWHWMVSLW